MEEAGFEERCDTAYIVTAQLGASNLYDPPLEGWDPEARCGSDNVGLMHL